MTDESLYITDITNITGVTGVTVPHTFIPKNVHCIISK